MKYLKTKIFLAITGLMIIVACAFNYQPKNWTGVSVDGERIECEKHSIKVAEVRSDPKSRFIKIEYVRLRSFSDNPEPPIFFLAGGPGQSATDQADNENYLAYWAQFLEKRDVVLVDQRGVGRWLFFWVNLKKLPEDVFVSYEVASTHFQSMAKKAAKGFRKRGFDVNGYNTMESAADLDEIRELHGYETIVPFGFSYGTHLALTYMKYYGPRVEKSIMIGSEGLDNTYKDPMDLDRQLQKLGNLLSQDSILGPQIPDMMVLYRDAAARLDREPVTITLKTPLKIKRDVRVGKFGLEYIMRRDLGDASDLRYFPRLLHNIAHGDGSELQFYMQKRYIEFMGFSGMTISMDLASGLSSERREMIASGENSSVLGKIANFPFLDVEDFFPVKDLGDEFRASFSTAAPVLFLSGDLDSNTPAYQAEQISETFSNSTHLVVENAGHEQIQFHRQTTIAIERFLRGEDVGGMEIAYPALEFKGLGG